MIMAYETRGSTMQPIDADLMMTAAAAAGSASAQLANRSQDNLSRKACEMMVGAMTGIFLGPAIADSYSLVQQNVRTAIAFVVGSIGVFIVTGLMDLAKGSGLKLWMSRWVQVGQSSGSTIPNPGNPTTTAETQK